MQTYTSTWPHLLLNAKNTYTGTIQDYTQRSNKNVTHSAESDLNIPWSLQHLKCELTCNTTITWAWHQGIVSLISATNLFFVTLIYNQAFRSPNFLWNGLWKATAYSLYLKLFDTSTRPISVPNYTNKSHTYTAYILFHSKTDPATTNLPSIYTFHIISTMGVFSTIFLHFYIGGRGVSITRHLSTSFLVGFVHQSEGWLKGGGG